MSVIPNCYYGGSSQSPSLASHYLSSQSLLNNSTIIQYLSSALRVSVANYRLSYEQTLPPSPSVPQMSVSEAIGVGVPANALELGVTAEE